MIPLFPMLYETLSERIYLLVCVCVYMCVCVCVHVCVCVCVYMCVCVCDRYNELMFLIDTCQAASMFRTFYSPNIVACGSSAVNEDALSVRQYHHGVFSCKQMCVCVCVCVCSTTWTVL